MHIFDILPSLAGRFCLAPTELNSLVLGVGSD